VPHKAVFARKAYSLAIPVHVPQGHSIATKNNKEALATVDTALIEAAIAYKLQWKSC
jgi:hypothetical protein